MLFLVIYYYLTYYFFIPLAIGLLLLAVTQKQETGIRVIAGFAVVVGVWGAVTTIPSWIGYAVVRYQNHQYFQEQCTSIQEIRPTQMLTDNGLSVLLDRDSLVSTENLERLVRPDLSRFDWISVKLVSEGQLLRDEGVKIWTLPPENISTLEAQRRKAELVGSLPAPKHQFEIERASTPLDIQRSVHRDRLTIRNIESNEIVAQRVQLHQSGFFDNNNPSAKVCPDYTPSASGCADGFKCSPGWSFPLRVFQPVSKWSLDQLFYIHKESPVAKRSRGCYSGNIAFGPGIEVQDIEWYGQENGGAYDLILRYKKTGASIACTGFFSGFGSVSDFVTFQDGSRFPLYDFINRSSQAIPLSPQSLLK